MNKTELIAAVADKANITKQAAAESVNAVLEVIVADVAAGNKVSIPGFGTFEPRKREERQGINPRTKEKITYPATTVPAFKAGKTFKDAVSG